MAPMNDGEGYPVAVIGMMGGEVFGRAAAEALAGVDVVVGSPRQLAHLSGTAGTGHRGTAGSDRSDCVGTAGSDRSDRLGTAGSDRSRDPSRPTMARRVELTGPLPPLIDQIRQWRHEGRRVGVLASGDPGFFGIARTLAARLGPGSIRIYPAPSAVALACASQGWSWDDAVVVSAHGRALAPAVDVLEAAPKAAVLTGPANPPEAVGAALVERGCRREVVVVSRIGEPDETVCHTDQAGLAGGHFDAMSVVLLTAPAHLPSDGPSVRWGRDEDGFAHRDGMITKAETRAVALGKLSLQPTGVLWDVGAGSGSVGIEAAALAPRLGVYAVERNARDAEAITANAAAYGVHVTLVVGEAPGVLTGLPDPDRVFIGGGGIGVLDACLHRLRPGGVVVATYVLLDRALAGYHRLHHMIQVHVDRCVPLGSAGVRMEPANPVFVCWGPE